MSKRKPVVSFDAEKERTFKELCRLKPQLRDAAEILDVSEDTLTRYCRKQGCTYAEFRDKKMAKTRMMLIKKALDMAQNGNATMLIFCLKNLCQWADNPEIMEEDNTLEFS